MDGASLASPVMPLANQDPLFEQPSDEMAIGETINQTVGCAAGDYFGLLENTIDVLPLELFHERVSYPQSNENIQIILWSVEDNLDAID